MSKYSVRSTKYPVPSTQYSIPSTQFSGLESLGRSTRPRRGSIYIVTLMTAMIVTAMAIAALATVRVQRRQGADADTSRQAQLHAMSALQIARYYLRTDPAWRSNLSNGRWATNQPIGTGYYSFTGVDPVDGNLLVGDADPVIITAVGKQGDCIHSIAGCFEFTQPGLACLQSSIHAPSTLNTDKVTLTSSGAPISSNSNILIGFQSNVTANCEAVTGVTVNPTATLTGTANNAAPVRQMPDNSLVVNYYQNMGTAIAANTLPLWDREYLQNPGAEAVVVEPWVASNCSVAISSTIQKSGTYSFYVYNRTVLADGVKQDITSQVAQNVQYNVSASVYVDSIPAADNFRIHVLLSTSNGNVSYLSNPLYSGVGTWVSMSFTPTLTWTGTLNSAHVFVQSTLGLMPFYFDDVSVKESAATPNTYVMHRKLLSSQSNTVNGVLNDKGVYVLRCDGNQINIRNSRIAGTLVILDPGANSRIEGSMHWEPATSLSTNPNNPNYPALVSNGQLEVGTDATSLSEAVCNVNFNPNGTPYGSSSDTDLLDTYPSQISGVVFSSAKLKLSNRTAIIGSVVSGDIVEVAGSAPASTAVNVTHQPLYYYANPPIGFRATPVVTLKPGSVEQIVQ